jgi:hypothetical protein
MAEKGTLKEHTVARGLEVGGATSCSLLLNVLLVILLGLPKRGASFQNRSNGGLSVPCFVRSQTLPRGLPFGIRFVVYDALVLLRSMFLRAMALPECIDKALVGQLAFVVLDHQRFRVT